MLFRSTASQLEAVETQSPSAGWCDGLPGVRLARCAPSLAHRAFRPERIGPRCGRGSVTLHRAVAARRGARERAPHRVASRGAGAGVFRACRRFRRRRAGIRFGPRPRCRSGVERHVGGTLRRPSSWVVSQLAAPSDADGRRTRHCCGCGARWRRWRERCESRRNDWQRGAHVRGPDFHRGTAPDSPLDAVQFHSGDGGICARGCAGRIVSTVGRRAWWRDSSRRACSRAGSRR